MTEITGRVSCDIHFFNVSSNDKSPAEKAWKQHSQSVCLTICLEQGSIASEAAVLDWLRIAEDSGWKQYCLKSKGNIHRSPSRSEASHVPMREKSGRKS